MKGREGRGVHGGLPLVLLALACAVPQSAPEQSPVEARLGDPAALADARRLFLGACAGYCHGTGADSRGDAPDLFDCEWIHGGRDEQVFQAISAGVPGTLMEGFQGRLPDDEIWGLVAYLKSRSRCETEFSRAACTRPPSRPSALPSGSGRSCGGRPA